MSTVKDKERARAEESDAACEPPPRKRARQAPGADSDSESSYQPGSDAEAENSDDEDAEPDLGDSEDEEEGGAALLELVEEEATRAVAGGSSKKPAAGDAAEMPSAPTKQKQKRKRRAPERSGNELASFRAAFPVPQLPPLDAPPPPSRPSLADNRSEEQYAAALYAWLANDLSKSGTLPFDLEASRRRLGLRSATASVQLLSAPAWMPPPLHEVFTAASLAAATASLHALYYRCYPTPLPRYREVAVNFARTIAYVVKEQGMLQPDYGRSAARVVELDAAVTAAKAQGVPFETMWAQYVGIAVNRTPSKRVEEDYVDGVESNSGSFLKRLIHAGHKAGEALQNLKPEPTNVRSIGPTTPLIEILQDEYHLVQLVAPAAVSNSVDGGARPQHGMSGRALPLRVARALTQVLELGCSTPTKVVLLRSADSTGSPPERLEQAVKHAIGNEAYPIQFVQHHTAPQRPFYSRLAQGRLFGRQVEHTANFSALSNDPTITQQQLDYVDAETRVARAEVLWAVRCAADAEALSDGTCLPGATAYSDDAVLHLALCEALLQAAEEGSEVVAEVECWDLDCGDRTVVVGLPGEASVRARMEQVLPLPYPLRFYKREVSPCKVLEIAFRDGAVVRIVFGLSARLACEVSNAIEGVAIAAAIEAISSALAKQAYSQAPPPLAPPEQQQVQAMAELVRTVALARIDDALLTAGTLGYAILGANSISHFAASDPSISFIWAAQDSFLLSALPLSEKLAAACASSALVVKVGEDSDGAFLRVSAKAEDSIHRSWSFASLVPWEKTQGIVQMLAHAGHGSALQVAQAKVKSDPWLALSRSALRLNFGKRVLVQLLSSEPTLCAVALENDDKMVNIEIGFSNELLAVARETITMHWISTTPYLPSPKAGRLSLPKWLFSRVDELVALIRRGEVQGDFRWNDRGGFCFRARASKSESDADWVEYGFWSAAFWQIFTEASTRNAELLVPVKSKGKPRAQVRHGYILAYEAVKLQLQNAFKSVTDRAAPRWLSEPDFRAVYKRVVPDLREESALRLHSFHEDMERLNTWALKAHIDRALPTLKPSPLIRPNASFDFTVSFKLSRRRFLSERMPFAPELLDELRITDRKLRVAAPGFLALDLPKALLALELNKDGEERDVHVRSVEYGRIGISFAWTVGESRRELFLPLIIARILSEIRTGAEAGQALFVLVHLLVRRHPTEAAALSWPPTTAQLEQWRQELKATIGSSRKAHDLASEWLSRYAGDGEEAVSQELRALTEDELSDRISELLAQLEA